MSETTVAEQTQETVEVKPVYKMSTGIPSQETTTTEVAEQQTETTAAETTSTETSSDTQTTEAEDNATSFEIPSFGEQQEQQQTQQAEAPKNEAEIVISWKDEIKNLSPKEVLKELGYDEFVAEFAEFRKNGGDAYKYLEAKAFDWNKVSHQDLVISDLKAQYPHLAEDKIQKLYENKYKQSEYASEEDKEIGLIQLEADAELVRQKKIAEQQSFKIPDSPKTQEAAQNEQVLIEQQQLAERQRQEAQKFFQEHEATKALYESKRVAIDLGDYGKFNFKIDKPDALMSVVLDSEKWQRVLAVNPQEADVTKLVPDVAKLQKLALVALNPNYEKDLVNFGKSLGVKAVVEEGQNAKRPTGNVPAHTDESINDAFKLRAREGKVGG